MKPTPEQIDFLRNFCGRRDAPPVKVATAPKIGQTPRILRCHAYLLAACERQQDLKTPIEDCQSKFSTLVTDLEKDPAPAQLNKASDLLSELNGPRPSTVSTRP